MIHRNDYAPKAAYDVHRKDEAERKDMLHPKWEELSEEDKEKWRSVASATVGASPAPFFLEVSIKLPNQDPLGENLRWYLFFGLTDEEIEQAGEKFVAKMKAFRDVGAR